MDVAVSDGRGTSDLEQERDHAVRVALVGIEASAERLSGHRSLLTTEQLDELARSLANEARFLPALLEGRTTAVNTFDLAEALELAAASARQSGMDVRGAVPRGTAVVGHVDRTAQVLFVLLELARQHAPASPVDVCAHERCGKMEVRVGGPGCSVSDDRHDVAFECDVRADRSVGSGHGLDVARRITEHQGGELAVHSRPGGGVMFVLHLLRPAAERAPHRGGRLSCLESR